MGQRHEKEKIKEKITKKRKPKLSKGSYTERVVTELSPVTPLTLIARALEEPLGILQGEGQPHHSRHRRQGDVALVEGCLEEEEQESGRESGRESGGEKGQMREGVTEGEGERGQMR